MVLKATLSLVDFLNSRKTVKEDLCKVAFNILATWLLFQLKRKYLRWEVRQTMQSIQILVVRSRQCTFQQEESFSHFEVMKIECQAQIMT